MNDKTKASRLASRRPSLRDVARLAGVTPAAVSYVVNGRIDQVGADTLTRIQDAIKAVRYQPQRRGLSLKFSRDFAIGLVIVDPDPNFLADPFTTQVASGLSNALIEPGYSMMVSGIRSLENLTTFLRRRVDVDALAVILSGPPEMRDEAYEMVNALGLPVVVIQDRLPACVADGCAVFQDDEGGAKALTHHLIDEHARSFLFVSPVRAWPAMERRERGIVAGLGGRHPLHRLECDEQDYVGTLGAIEETLKSGPVPDAIIGGNDQIAIAVLKALTRLDIRIRERVKVTGFNNFVFRNYTAPLLTTVTSAAYEMGQQAAEAILLRLGSGEFAGREISFPVSLVLGETT